jgi:hypothetical protein
MPASEQPTQHNMTVVRESPKPIAGFIYFSVAAIPPPQRWAAL